MKDARFQQFVATPPFLSLLRRIFFYPFSLSRSWFALYKMSLQKSFREKKMRVYLFCSTDEIGSSQFARGGQKSSNDQSVRPTCCKSTCSFRLRFDSGRLILGYLSETQQRRTAHFSFLLRFTASHRSYIEPSPRPRLFRPPPRKSSFSSSFSVLGRCTSQGTPRTVSFPLSGYRYFFLPSSLVLPNFSLSLSLLSCFGLLFSPLLSRPMFWGSVFEFSA